MKIEKKMNNESLIKNQLDKFMEARIPVHIVLKKKVGAPKWVEPRFLNGTLTGKKSKDIYIIKERKFGETYLLIDDIYSVTVYEKSNEELIKEKKEKMRLRIGEGVSDDDIDLIDDFFEENEEK